MPVYCPSFGCTAGSSPFSSLSLGTQCCTSSGPGVLLRSIPSGHWADRVHRGKWAQSAQHSGVLLGGLRRGRWMLPVVVLQLALRLAGGSMSDCDSTEEKGDELHASQEAVTRRGKAGTRLGKVGAARRLGQVTASPAMVESADDKTEESQGTTTGGDLSPGAGSGGIEDEVREIERGKEARRARRTSSSARGQPRRRVEGPGRAKGKIKPKGAGARGSTRLQKIEEDRLATPTRALRERTKVTYVEESESQSPAAAKD